LTGALHNLQLQLSPPLPSSLASIKPANPGLLGKMAVKTESGEERRIRNIQSKEHDIHVT